MMFGHLKAEDFINRIEGDELPADLRTHLQSCRECAESLASAQSLHSAMTQAAASEGDIPEPDWSQFRMDVRNSMLSRSAQRQPKLGWAGWLLRPAMSWGLAIAFTAGLSAGLFIWNQHGSQTAPAIQTASVTAVPQTPAGTAPSAVLAVETLKSASDTKTEDVRIKTLSTRRELAAWSATSAFESVAQLNEAQSIRFQELLAGATEVPPSQ